MTPAPPSSPSLTPLLSASAGPALMPRWWIWVLVSLTLAGVGWLFLHELGAQPLQYWDEARLAVNALTCNLRHDWLVMYYGPYPDTLNTKPPLMVNLQALAYHFLGVSTGVLRLPAALAGACTAALLLGFAWRGLHSPGAGMVAAVALATMPGFNGTHVARTGDYDALLALFTTGYCLCAYTYLQHRRPVFLLLFGSLLASALLTKCSAALLPLPGLVAYTWRYHPTVFYNRRVWQVGAAAFGPLLLFYMAREIAYPGYLRFTLFYDWAGAVALPLTGRTPWWFYEPVLWRGLGPWRLALLLVGGLLLVGRWRSPIPSVISFTLWQVAGLLLVGLVAQTRMPWYITHAYPMLALALGCAANTVVLLVRWSVGRWAAVGIWGGLGLWAGAETLQRHQALARVPLRAHEQYGAALTRLNQLPLLPDSLLLLTESYNPLVDYYLLTAPRPYWGRLERQRLPDQQPEQLVRELLPGWHVLGCLPRVRRLVEQEFETTPLVALDSCWCLRLGRHRRSN